MVTVLRAKDGVAATLEVLRGRLNQWASHTGVFARDACRPKMFPDARLMYSESLRSLVLQYLAITKRHLGHSMQPSTTDSFVALGRRRDYLLMEGLQALESAINSLHGLETPYGSMAI